MPQQAKVKEAKSSRDPALTWEIPQQVEDALTERVDDVRFQFSKHIVDHLRSVSMQLLLAEGLEDATQWSVIITRLVNSATSLISPKVICSANVVQPLECMTVQTLPGVGCAEDSEVIDGVAFCGSISHKRMRAYFSEPRFLLLSGSIEFEKVEDKLSSFDDFVDSEKQYLKSHVDDLLSVRPDVILMEGSVARYAQELLQTAGVSVVAHLESSTLLHISRCLGASICSTHSGPPQPSDLGSAQEYEVITVDDKASDSGSLLSTIIVIRGCRLSGMGTSILLKGPTKEELARVQRAAYLLLRTSYRNRLEAAFLGDQMAAEASILGLNRDNIVHAAQTIVENSIREVGFRNKDGIPLSASPHIPSAFDCDGMKISYEEMEKMSFDSVHRFWTTISCRNPSKGVICEPPHVHLMHFYSEDDLTLPQFLAAAAPTTQKCPHPQCGDGAGLHLRTFMHCDSLLTLSSFTVNPEKALPGGVWLWLRRLGSGTDKSTDLLDRSRRIQLSEDASCISFSHLLYLLMDARHLQWEKLDLRGDLVRYLCQGRTIICLHLTKIEPYQVAFPPSDLYISQSDDMKWLEGEKASIQQEADEVLKGLQRIFAKGSSDDSQACASALKRLQSSFDRYMQQLKILSSSSTSTEIVFLLHRLRRTIFIAAKMLATLTAAAETKSTRESSPDGAESNEQQEAESKDIAALKEAKEAPSVDDSPQVKSYAAPKLVESTVADDDSSVVEETHPETIPTGLVARIISRFEREFGRKDFASESRKSPISTSNEAIDKGKLVDATAAGRERPPSTTIELRPAPDAKLHPVLNLNNLAELEDDLQGLRDQVMQYYGELLSHGEELLAETAHRDRQSMPPGRFMPSLDNDNDSPVAVFDDEISSVISYFLSTKQYRDYIVEATNKCLTNIEDVDLRTAEVEDGYILRNSALQLDCLMIADDPSPPSPIKLQLTAYFAPQFAALRKILLQGNEDDFIASMSRCNPWYPEAGKSGLHFFKTLDDKFVIKELNSAEFRGILDFAPAYFKFMEKSLRQTPSCLAKILGVFSISIEHVGNDASKLHYNVIILENLFARRQLHKILDLKGASTGPEAIDEPLLISTDAWEKLHRRLERDCDFLSSDLGVMDYSLVVGMDDEKQELVVGIIDYLRTYTLDKHLETIVKGAASRKAPTIVAPKAYSSRFLKGMQNQFTLVPCVREPTNFSH